MNPRPAQSDFMQAFSLQWSSRLQNFRIGKTVNEQLQTTNFKLQTPLRTFILSITILFSFTTIYGQKKEVGIKAGISRTNIRSEELLIADLHDPALGFSAGFHGNLWLQKHLYLSSGVFFERAGSRTNDIDITDAYGKSIGMGDIIRQLNYITLPLNLNYAFGKKNNFAVGAGAFGSYLLSAYGKLKVSLGSLDSLSDASKKTNYKDLFNDFNFGLHFIGSYRLQLQKNKILLLAVEDHLGLNDLHDSNALVSKPRSHSIGFYASLLFTMK